MKSKLHRATVTEANLHYVGSLTLDRNLMDLAGLVANEKVQVVDIDNGERFETYIIDGSPGSGVVCMNGAAARRVQPGDKIIVISYGMYDERETRRHQPVVVVCDERNRGARLPGPEAPSVSVDDLLIERYARSEL